MTKLCQYKDIFGQPNTGIHSIRRFNIAMVDLLATVLLGVFIKNTFQVKLDTIYIVLLLVLISIPIHMFFCVNTTLTRLF